MESLKIFNGSTNSPKINRTYRQADRIRLWSDICSQNALETQISNQLHAIMHQCGCAYEDAFLYVSAETPSITEIRENIRMRYLALSVIYKEITDANPTMTSDMITILRKEDNDLGRKRMQRLRQLRPQVDDAFVSDTIPFPSAETD